MEEKIFVTRPSMPPMEEYIEEIQSIWDEHILTNMGPKHKKLEAELVNFTDCKWTYGIRDGDSGIESYRRSDYHAVYVCLYYTCNC